MANNVPKTDPIVLRLVQRAEALGMTVLELSRACGMHHSIIPRWIAGPTSPTLRGLRLVSETLDKLEADAKGAKAKAKAKRAKAREAATA